MSSAIDFRGKTASNPPSRRSASRRFLHVGALRIDHAGYGVPDLPDMFRSLYATAARSSLERVFETAVSENVDAVLLAGGLPNPAIDGFRPLALIYRQCRRLQSARIPVIAASRSDASISNVDFLRRPNNLAVVERSKRDSSAGPDRTVITVGDPNRRNRIDIGPTTMKSNARFRITFDLPQKKKQRSRFDYIALGTNPNAGAAGDSTTKLLAHDPGSPQGFGPFECGPHGVSLVTLHRDKPATIETHSCDVIRHHSIIVEITNGTTDDALKQIFQRHVHSLSEDRSVGLHIVEFNIQGHGTVFEQLRNRRVRESRLKQLRDRWSEPSDATPREGSVARTSVSIWISKLDISPDETQRCRERELAGSAGRFVQLVENAFPTHRDRVVATTTPMLTPHL